MARVGMRSGFRNSAAKPQRTRSLVIRLGARRTGILGLFLTLAPLLLGWLWAASSNRDTLYLQLLLVGLLLGVAGASFAAGIFATTFRSARSACQRS